MFGPNVAALEKDCSSQDFQLLLFLANWPIFIIIYFLSLCVAFSVPTAI